MNSPVNPGNSAPPELLPPTEATKRLLLDLTTAELERGGFVSEFGLGIATFFPEGANCHLSIFAHTNGAVDPERPNLLATITRISHGENRFIGPHEATEYEIMAIPDGLHVTKHRRIIEQERGPYQDQKSVGGVAGEAELYLALTGLVQNLEESIVEETEARMAERAIGMDFVCESDLQELILIFNSPRAVDTFGNTIR